MPELYSRQKLIIKDIKCRMIQDLSNAGNIDDMIKEGITTNFVPPADYVDLKNKFISLWNSIYLKKNLGYDTNPWCFNYYFGRAE